MDITMLEKYSKNRKMQVEFSSPSYFIETYLYDVFIFSKNET